MDIVTYHALDPSGQPLVIEHLTLRQSLELAETHLHSGVRPVALDLDRRHFDTTMLMALLDVWRQRKVEQCGYENT